jgi:hypothetical protein
MDVIGDTPPFMHHNDPGSLGRNGIVVYDEALQCGFAVLIGDRLFLDRSVCVRDHCDGPECSHDNRSHADLLRILAQLDWHVRDTYARLRKQYRCPRRLRLILQELGIKREGRTRQHCARPLLAMILLLGR